MEINIERVARSTLKRLSSRRYHWQHAAQARAILRTYASHDAKPDPAQLRLADAYAQDVLGHLRYAPWLHVYTAVAGRFKEGWIPDNFYGSVVVPAVKGPYGELSMLRCLQRTIFHSDAFPDVAYYANGSFVMPGNEPVSRNDLKARLFAGRDEVVFKIDNSGKGQGLFFFERDTFDPRAVEALGNGVFQQRIVQHDALARYAPRSIATIRMTTVVDERGDIGLRACYLRLGRADDDCVQSNRQIRVAVDLASGELAAQGFGTDWLRIPAHPDTQVPFAGARIPSFDACKATVIALHRKVPLIRSVGWDLAVGPGGEVIVMEWNASHNDIKFSEATQGPCFADLHWERLAHRDADAGRPRPTAGVAANQR